MAVGFLSATASHAAAAYSVSQTSFSWNVTGDANAKGVLVLVFGAVLGADIAGTVTYGSKTLVRVPTSFSCDTAGEPGFVCAYFLGSDVAQTGTISVTVNRTSDTTRMAAMCVLVSAGTATTEIPSVSINTQNEQGTFAQLSVNDGSPGADSMRFAAGYYGGASPAPIGNLSTGIGWGGTGLSDLVAYGWSCARETTAGQGARSVGFTAGTSDDRAYLALAVSEPVGGTAPVVVAFTDDVHARSSAQGRNIAVRNALVADTEVTQLWLGGDLADTSSADYTAASYGYDAVFGSSLNSITYASPGNHDFSDSTGYNNYFDSRTPGGTLTVDQGHRYYVQTITVGDTEWRIYHLSIGLDGTYADASGSGSAQLTWLQNDLSANPGHPIIAIGHGGRWGSYASSGYNTTDLAPYTSDIYAALHSAGADLYLCGHQHQYVRWPKMDETGASASDGIRQITGPTSSEYGNAYSEAVPPMPDSNVKPEAHNADTGVYNNQIGYVKIKLYTDHYAWDYRVTPDTGGSTSFDSGSENVHNTGSGNATVTPTNITRPTTIPTPTVSISVAISPSSISVPATIATPTTQVHVTITPSSISVPVTVPTPAVSTSTSITKSTVSIPVTVPTPSTSVSVAITPSIITASTTVATPTTRVSIAATPSIITAPATVATPSTTVSIAISRATIAIAATVPQPAVSTSAAVAPSILTGPVTLPTPSLITGVTLSPAKITVAVPVSTPVVTTGTGDATITPSIITLATTFGTRYVKARRINTFEGGTNGVTITAANSGGASGDKFDTVYDTGNKIVYDNATPIHGSLDAKITVGSDEFVEWISVDPSGEPSDSFIRFRGYIMFGDPPASGAETVLSMRNSDDNISWQLQFNSDYKAQVVDADGSVIWTTTATLFVGMWTRVEAVWQINTRGAGRLRVALFIADLGTRSYGSGTWNSTTANLYGAGLTSRFKSVRFGAGALMTNPFYLDDLALDQGSEDWFISTPDAVNAILGVPTGLSPVAVPVTINQPEVTTGGDAYPTPSLITLTTVVATPTVTVSVAISPSSISIPATVAQPTVSTSVGLLPGSITVPVSIPFPAVEAGGNVTLTPSSIPVAVTVATPAVSTGAGATPGILTVPVSIPTPALAVSVAISPASISIPASIAASSLTVAVSCAPAAITVPVSIATPEVSAGYSVTLTPGVITCPATIQHGSVSTEGNVDLNLAAINVPVTVASPAVSAGYSVALTPTKISVPVTVEHGSVVTEGNVSLDLDAITVPVSVGTPNLTAAVAVSPPTVAVTTTVGGGTLTVSVAISPSIITCSTVVRSGSVQTEGNINLNISSITVPVAVSAPAAVDAGISQALTPAKITVPVTFGARTVFAVTQISPNLITLPVTVRTPTTIRCDAVLAISSIAVPVVLPTPAASSGSSLSIGVITVGTIIRTPAVGVGVAITPDRITATTTVRRGEVFAQGQASIFIDTAIQVLVTIYHTGTWSRIRTAGIEPSTRYEGRRPDALLSGREAGT